MNIFIFHNDLRLYDNTGLIEATKAGKTIPIFVFTQQQIGKQNQYRSQNAINFMCGALLQLDAELRKHGSQLHLYYGNTHTIIEQLIKKYKVTGVHSNMNYTPFAIERDALIKKYVTSIKLNLLNMKILAYFPLNQSRLIMACMLNLHRIMKLH